MHEEDRKLVSRWMSRDTAAFNEFFADYFPRLFRFTLRRVNDDPEAARDIVQAALTRGGCSGRAIEPDGPIRRAAARSVPVHRCAGC